MESGRILRREKVDESLAGLRLDQAAARMFPDYSRSRLQMWIKSGELTVNSQILKKRENLKAGDIIEIAAELEAAEDLAAESMALDVRYQDDHLLVINKPDKLVVHPAAGHPDGTLLNGLLHQYPELAQLPRAGLIHRLDKNTTGLLLVARSLPAHTALVRQLRQRHIQREYQALTTGVPTTGGIVDQPIGRHPVHRKRMAVLANGRPARTHYHILERFRAHGLLRVALESGRTHQIRVHLSWLGYPVIGDRAYGGRPKPAPRCLPELGAALREFPRQALHACRLAWTHPISGAELECQSELPRDMEELLALLRLDAQCEGES